MHRATSSMAWAAAACMAVSAAQAEVRDAIVKIYTIHNRPDYYNPWAMRGPAASTGSGCIMEGRRILSNAHVVGDRTFVQVRKDGDPKRYEAKVVNVSHEADLAILTVEDPAFFAGVAPLELGPMPEAQQEVTVYGFPLGGDTLSTTKGVVSRFEHQVYVHSSCYLFAGQIDAAINPGNSGGPVVQDGRIVGVVMQAISQADNIGYMVPPPVIEHFFKDIADGRYDGFPSLGCALQDMENPDLKRKYGVREDQTGMLVAKIFPGSPADGVLQPGDVLTAVDGHPIADDGTVEFRPRSRTSAAYFVQRRQVGEVIDLDVIRGGDVSTVQLKLHRPMWEDWLVPSEQYDVLPTYYIYGGIVFIPLTKDFLEAWGPNWYQNAPDMLTVYLARNYQDEIGQEVVLAMKVLAADVNQGYHSINNWVVEEVDGRKIKNLRELIAAVETEPRAGFVTFSGPSGQRIVLDRAKVAASQAAILATYRVPEDRSPDLR